ncbi:hypothetical protein SAMN04488029_0330 [Reichenbachiella faecimaris]|uniref:Uncharacterized protein n=1 Tax=Reichenbachiella faecimaris TaxID=692418 RepID=A0A1W2G6C7_REIFA|nr:hypothetical protein [Reichenbachiella faecimaris]SMD31992.1 hypothetical protein SAMN04488029_0330 [Reichenbachiella faecimaris]
MILRLTFFLLWILGGFGLHAQTMEEQVTIYLETFLDQNKSTIFDKMLNDSEWTTSDLMGESKINFDANKKFKRENGGFQATTNKVRGHWYIHNEYVVLEVKKVKTPMYILKNGDQIVLIDDDQIDILKQLLTEASYKDGALKPYSYDEIFTFLNGFTLENK